MSPANQFHNSLIGKAVRWLLLLSVLSGGWLCWSAARLESMESISAKNHPQDLPDRVQQADAIDSIDWSVFQSGDGSVVSTGSISSRYRLAGTFFTYTEGLKDTRKAVLDDLKAGIQRIVAERDRFGDVEVVRIVRDRITLRDHSGEEQLRLSFSGRQSSSQSGGTNAYDTAQNGPIPSNRFGGSQVVENSWVFSRQTLMDYYQELRDEPQRLVAVFDSLKPVYDDSRKISGYRLGIEGEAEFFEAAGLKEGDVVRKVNNIDMSSRRRAEFLISQFVMDNASVFLFDVDRADERVKMNYQIR